MEIILKAMLGVVNCWIGAVVEFHDMLHRFRAGRGAGTASLEAKLPQQLAVMRGEVLYEFLLDLIKAY